MKDKIIQMRGKRAMALIITIGATFRERCCNRRKWRPLAYYTRCNIPMHNSDSVQHSLLSILPCLLSPTPLPSPMPVRGGSDFLAQHSKCSLMWHQLPLQLLPGAPSHLCTHCFLSLEGSSLLLLLDIYTQLCFRIPSQVSLV